MTGLKLGDHLKEAALSLLKLPARVRPVAKGNDDKTMSRAESSGSHPQVKMTPSPPSSISNVGAAELISRNLYKRLGLESKPTRAELIAKISIKQGLPANTTEADLIAKLNHTLKLKPTATINDLKVRYGLSRNATLDDLANAVITSKQPNK